jgi:spermidine/putrescine transport system ATP-binding protein/putrescine transport system ATP-binding protein
LLDAPLSALDRKVRSEMQLELKRLQHEVGITFVVVTHDQEEAMSMADRIAVMADGRVQQVASPIELYRQPVNHFVADFVGTSNLFIGQLEGGTFQSTELGALPGRGARGRSGSAYLVIRPEDVRLTAGAEADGPVRGVVSDVQFKGGSSHVAVDVSGLPRPFLASVPGAAAVSRGQSIALDWTTAVVVPGALR